MSEPAQPLSRRERRALEEAARAAEGEVTQALPVAPETESTLSRRERRRLERLANPLETWTEEEELIATGQMPAMTPEVLAEQDRLVAERAAAAAAASQAYAETAPVAEPQPGPAADAETSPVSEPQPEPVAQEAPAGGIPEGLRHLFPPGSLQAQAFEQQPVAPVQATTPDAADEIRRLTQEAMAGIAKVTTGATPAVAEEPVDVGTVADEPLEAVADEPVVEQPTPDLNAESVPDLPEGVDVEELWNAPTVDEPVRDTPVTSDAAASEPEPAALDEVPFVAEVPVPSEPGLDTVEAAPVWNALVPATPTKEAREAADPVTLATPQPAPSMWDTHPLTNPGASPVREIPAEPVQQDLPRPDLSVLLGTQAANSVGQEAYASTEPSTSTTSVPLRHTEPKAEGGARHFRWAHLAVIGAIAFVLGVLAWNIARSGS